MDVETKAIAEVAALLTDEEIVAATKEYQRLELQSMSYRNEQTVIQTLINKNAHAKNALLDKLTAHYKTRRQHSAVVVLLEQSVPQAAVIQHKGFQAYPTARVDITFFDRPAVDLKK